MTGQISFIMQISISTSVYILETGIVIRDFKIVDDVRLRRLIEFHATFTPLRCHRRSSGTVCFPAVSRRGEDG